MKKLLAVLLTLFMLFSLVSCLDIQDIIEKAKNEENNEEYNNDDNGNANDEEYTGYVFDVEEDDHTIVVKYTDTITYVFGHDGTNITSYVSYVDMKTEEYAKIYANNFDLSDPYFDYLKSITVKGKYVLLEYTKDHIPYKTVQEVRSLFSANND